MWRRAFHVAAVVSFVLCVAVHVCWLRSYLCTEKVSWSGTRGWRSVQTAQRRIQVCLLLVDRSGGPTTQFHGPTYERVEPRPPMGYIDYLCSSRGDINIAWKLGRFAWDAKLNFQQQVHHSSAVLPCWFLAAATLALPLVATTLRLRCRDKAPTIGRGEAADVGLSE